MELRRLEFPKGEESPDWQKLQEWRDMNVLISAGEVQHLAAMAIGDDPEIEIREHRHDSWNERLSELAEQKENLLRFADERLNSDGEPLDLEAPANEILMAARIRYIFAESGDQEQIALEVVQHLSEKIFALNYEHLLVAGGHSAAGKGANAEYVASWLGINTLDADDLHSAAAVDVMHGGEAISPKERHEWFFERVMPLVGRYRQLLGPIVLQASCLSEPIRESLSEEGDDVSFANFFVGGESLDESAAIVAERQQRDHDYIRRPETGGSNAFIAEQLKSFHALGDYGFTDDDSRYELIDTRPNPIEVVQASMKFFAQRLGIK